MKKVFLESNGYNMVGFVFDDGMVAFDCETIEDAEAMDCSGVEGCKTAEEAAVNCNTEVYQFNEDEWECVTLIGKAIKDFEDCKKQFPQYEYYKDIAKSKWE